MVLVYTPTLGYLSRTVRLAPPVAEVLERCQVSPPTVGRCQDEVLTFDVLALHSDQVLC